MKIINKYNILKIVFYNEFEKYLQDYIPKTLLLILQFETTIVCFLSNLTVMTL